MVGDPADVIIDAPAEWLDRLVSVLVDNACRYSGDGGTVKSVVSNSGELAVLTVDDSGPGIPEAQRGPRALTLPPRDEHTWWRRTGARHRGRRRFCNRRALGIRHC